MAQSTPSNKLRPILQDASTSEVASGDTTICTAIVTHTASAGQSTPTGTITFTNSGSGSFGGSPCTLAGTGTTSSCSVSYTPTAVGSGTHTLMARYGGDALHDPSSGATTVTVRPAVPTSKDRCKQGGWRNYPQFKNQGDCVSFVATHGKNQPG